MMPISVLSSSRNGSIEAIAAMIEEEERLIANTVSRLNVENLRETWNKYAESHESPSTKAAMLHAELVLEDKKVLFPLHICNNIKPFETARYSQPGNFFRNAFLLQFSRYLVYRGTRTNGIIN